MKPTTTTERRRLPFSFWVGVFLMIVGAAGWITLHLKQSQPMEVSQILVGDTPYLVEVARTPHQQSQGLMFRDTLDVGRGMLFVGQEQSGKGIWMKNTKIALDVLFFDQGGTLVHINENTPPCTADPCPAYFSPVPATHILELAAGQVAAHGISKGTKLTGPALN